tara:strand:+ start:4287 stop:5156 length:870 start_codon:yes stop_codon:yes gene_type:complete
MKQTLKEYEVFVVDNASKDESCTFIQNEYRNVNLIKLRKNLGFAGACNAGIRSSKGDIVVLLNNDTEVTPNWLEKILEAFENNPEVGIVASRMMLFDRRDIFHAAGDLFRSDGMAANRGVWEKDVGQYMEDYVFSACGGAAGYRRSMLDEVGLLDESFFFSLEDIDMAWRSQLKGWKTLYVPSAVVYHHLSATGGGSVASYFDGRNSIYVLVKDVPNVVWRIFWRSILWRQILLACQSLMSWKGNEARARLRGQIVGILTIPRVLLKRKYIQSNCKVSSDYIRSILTEI